ncbi:hypothetical protein ASG89_34450 [Paenibacillus sp. Soil766]|uniref:hypothetical protein n=1 Tax=Paenibacillus sp. Soil766 TaxID=1736404 RepID=UPI00070F5D74|nr:hypothetical protein [Paenibacillus sp. Soil766]KRE91143.1 hypothetical protein ASG89_34450 [Paenibacillus sp. Soil766]
MQKVIPLGVVLLAIMLTGCGDKEANLENGAFSSASSHIPMPVTSEYSPSALSVSTPSATDAHLAKEDDSIRAIGTHSDGRLLVKPVSKAGVAPLGAPSCFGVETDLRWSGDYEVVWESKSEGNATPIRTFPIDLEIVQQNDSPVIMQPFTLEDTNIFAYVPRYTDCHGLETYLFGVSKGKAFPISLEMKPEVNWTSINQLPRHPFKVAGGEFIVTGGYGAGQDLINVYHFRYDPNKKSMILKSTNQVKPSDL